MKRFTTFSIFFCLCAVYIILFTRCQKDDGVAAEIKTRYPETVSFSVQNSADLLRRDAPVFLDVGMLKKEHPDFNSDAFVLLHAGNEISSQADDINGDGNPDQITFVMDFLPKETKTVTLRYAPSGKRERSYPKRTQAEVSHKIGGAFAGKEYAGGHFQNVNYVRVPPEQTDHDTYFRYEGPGWESDKVGYRFYLDWRNAIDIFGKKVPDMVLQNVGLDGFDSYHQMADWGMDILQVGGSLGIGSIGMWHNGTVYMVSETDSVTCAIAANGPVRSHIKTRYFGWNAGPGKYDLTSDLSIIAGSRLTRHTVTVSDEPPNLCTGFAKHEDCEILTQRSEGEGEWQYLGLYGPQSLAGDKLGIAIVYRKSDLIDVTEDALSHIIILRSEQGKVTYYFLAAWEQEPDGIQNLEEFRNYLEETITGMNNPIIVKLCYFTYVFTV